MNMTFTKSIMVKVCLLVAVFMLSSVIGRDIVNSRENGDTDSSMHENVMYERRQAANSTARTSNFTCGLRPAITSKSNESNDEGEDSDLLDKILSGSNSSRGEVPWQVNIRQSGLHICGGAIINEYWVITSADCLSAARADSSVLTVVVGDHSLTATDPDEETFQTALVIVHDEFRSTLLDYNIGLLRIRAKASPGGRIHGFRFGDYVQPVCLPTESEVLMEGVELTISGWGFENYLEQIPPAILKKSTVRIGSVIDCSRWVSNVPVTERSTCARDNNSQSNVCVGDLGGPATYQFGGRAVLGAIISFGDHCFGASWPLILTRVAKFLDWIENAMNIGSSGND